MFELSVTGVQQEIPAALARRVLGLDEAAMASLDEGQAEAVILATQRVVNAAQAVQLLAIEALATRQREELALDPDPSPFGPQDEYEFLGDRLAPLLGLTPRGADARVDQAREICRRLPHTLAAMRAGDLDLYRADVIAGELHEASPTTCADVEEGLFPDALRLTSTRLRALARRRLHAADPGALRRRAERARSDRYVSVRPGDAPGVSHWEADQPTETTAAAWAAIDELAHRYVADGEHRSLEQARADAMMDLIVGNAEVRTVLEVVVPTTVDMETTGAQVPRVGTVLSETVLELLGNVDTRLRPVLTDPVTGWVREVGADAYLPNAQLRRQVRTRDGTCRFPGCRRSAWRCDLDHVIAFPLGPTTAAHLMALCRHHHRLKHHAGWTVTMTPLGVCTWTTPTGIAYVTTPMDYAELVA